MIWDFDTLSNMAGILGFLFSTILSILVIYYQFFHKPNSLLVTVDNIIIGKSFADVSSDDITFEPQFLLTFINTGKRNIAVTEITVRFSPNQNQLPAITVRTNVEKLRFSIKPGEIMLEQVFTVPSDIKGTSGDGYTIWGPNIFKFPEHYLWVNFVILTDDGKRISSEFVIGKVFKLTHNSHQFAREFGVFNLITKKKLNSLPKPKNPWQSAS